MLVVELCLSTRRAKAAGAYWGVQGCRYTREDSTRPALFDFVTFVKGDPVDHTARYSSHNAGFTRAFRRLQRGSHHPLIRDMSRGSRS